MTILQKIEFLNYFKGKSIWVSFLPIFIALYLLFSIISISLSQIFLSLSFIFWIVMLIKEKHKFTFPAFFWPLLVYTGLSLVSILFSVDPKASLKDSKELLLFIIIPLVYTAIREENVLKKVNLALLASAFISCFFTLFIFIFKASHGEKVCGFMGQCMTQAGLLLLFSCMALSMFLFSRERIRYLWGLGVALAIFALTLTHIRSSWIGLVIAASLILLLYKPKSLIIMPLAICLFYLISPQLIKNRALSIFDMKHPSNKERIEFIRVGIKIIKDFPLFGTGPDTVDMVFKNPKYGLSEEAKKNVHLHNNILQTAAERGIPTLLAWLTFIGLAFISLLKLLKNKDPTLYLFSVAALAALIGLFTAGLFEYNFADSEITALFLYIITIPFLLKRIQESKSKIEKTS